jgi:G3E family GTPase
VQHLFHPPALFPAWPDQDRRSRLVFIVKDLAEDAIRQEFSAVTAR